MFAHLFMGFFIHMSLKSLEISPFQRYPHTLNIARGHMTRRRICAKASHPVVVSCVFGMLVSLSMKFGVNLARRMRSGATVWPRRCAIFQDSPCSWTRDKADMAIDVFNHYDSLSLSPSLFSLFISSLCGHLLTRSTPRLLPFKFLFVPRRSEE